MQNTAAVSGNVTTVGYNYVHTNQRLHMRVNFLGKSELIITKRYICHAWQRWPPFPVNLHDLASLRLEGMQAKYSGRCTPLQYPLPDWYGPFGSSPPSRW